MPDNQGHLSDADLLLFADGEAPAGEAQRVRQHLDLCLTCRERVQAFEDAMSAFVSERNQELAAVIPTGAGPQALLEARLSRAASDASGRGWQLKPILVRGAVAAGFVCFAVAIVAFLGPRASAEGQQPDARMTPGETRPITLQEVCRSREAEVVAINISDEKRSHVLAAYGVSAAKADAFEVDFLITPDLGGADSLRNLWPQPYSARWNARTKDRLEQRLHDLVCAGKVDLGTAQHEIASDWIGAYRKYVGGRLN